MTEDLRCVWLTRKERDYLLDDCQFTIVAQQLVEQWDAAPQSPAVNVRDAIIMTSGIEASERSTHAVLSALRFPEGADGR